MAKITSLGNGNDVVVRNIARLFPQQEQTRVETIIYEEMGRNPLSLEGLAIPRLHQKLSKLYLNLVDAKSRVGTPSLDYVRRQAGDFLGEPVHSIKTSWHRAPNYSDRGEPSDGKEFREQRY